MTPEVIVSQKHNELVTTFRSFGQESSSVSGVIPNEQPSPVK
jgi:hypothetical protein